MSKLRGGLGLPTGCCWHPGERACAKRAWYFSLLMSKRFPEFSRLLWRSVKSQPGLHPAMRARMWKPGQSGNPSGVSRPIELSPGAERTRRWRQKRQQGVVVVSVDVAQDIVAEFIRFGWLDEAKGGDKEAIATALICIS